MFFSVDHHSPQQLSIYWGLTIPAIPDLISIEQFRTGCTYELALEQICIQQQSWVQQLHGDSRFTLSWRLISSGDSTHNLILGLVGKTTGQDEAETRLGAQLFFNQVRDAIPNGYPIELCEKSDELNRLRLPFTPSDRFFFAEFSRSVAALQTITNQGGAGQTGQQINLWAPRPGYFQALFRAFACHGAPVGIAINLRPTRLTPEENAAIAALADDYARMASRSTNDSMQIQGISSSVTYQSNGLEAEQAAQAWQQLNRAWRSPFEMSISLMADGPIPQSVTAALQSAISGEPKIELPVGDGNLHLATTGDHKLAVRQSWTDLAIHYWANRQDLGRLPWIFSPDEVHSIFRLPIADRQGVWGLPSAPGVNDARRLTNLQPTEAEIHLGTLKLSKKQLTQHLLIAGVPGSGKTNTSLYLIETLWRQHRIPWMVLEPAKTEYRGLSSVAALRDDILIFTLGDERTAPFRFNPFELPDGINLDSHMGALLDLFAVSMSMWGPLPNVVEQLIQEAYKRKGYTILGDNRHLVPPCFADVAALIPEIVAKLGYKKETTDEIKASLAVRLNKLCRGGLGAMLNTVQSLPFDELMQRPVILEMSAITNSDDRAFVIGLILNRCYQYWITRRHQATGELKHLLLIEEAHNLLANASESTNQEQANPKGKAVRNFANMLAEVRGFGQGIAIAEQNPEGLVPDVMVNTNLKLVHRVVEAGNRETLGRSMLLTPQQEKALASLRVGQCLYYVGGEAEPNLTVVPNFTDDPDQQFNPRLTDAEIQHNFQAFQAQQSTLYAPLYGCPTDPNLADCIERGRDAIDVLKGHTNYQKSYQVLILNMLMAPFGISVRSRIEPTLGRILVERGVQHLSIGQTQAILQSAIACLALEAAQEKGKVHGWLGKTILEAQFLLVDSLSKENFTYSHDWLSLCSISNPCIKGMTTGLIGQDCDYPDAFLYEVGVILNDKGPFLNALAKLGQDEKPSNFMKNWILKAMPPEFGKLTSSIQHSAYITAAILLTFSTPESPMIFL
jgi:DNA helicase HerA-like ATPase